MMTFKHETAFEAIVEHRCPVHVTPLERLEHFGWCETCGCGWWAHQARTDGALWSAGEKLVWQVFDRDWPR